jgi:hypothetical protein
MKIPPLEPASPRSVLRRDMLERQRGLTTLQARENIFLRLIFMFENEGETPAEKRERWKRQRKEFTDFVYRDLEELRRQRYS